MAGASPANASAFGSKRACGNEKVRPEMVASVAPRSAINPSTKAVLVASVASRITPPEQPERVSPCRPESMTRGRGSW